MTAPVFIPGPRPGKKSLERLKDLNLTHCVTLLSEREGGPAIERIAAKLGCEWVWLPIDGGRIEVLAESDAPALAGKLLDGLSEAPEPRVYVHCSAGIHRTGFFVYLLLRLQGLSAEDARHALAEMRQVTADQVGEDRLDLADRLLGDEVDV